MSTEFSSAEDVQDRTKWIWIGIIAIVLLMVGAMALWGGVDAPGSQVTVRHILIEFDQYDPAARARALDLIEDLRRQIVDGEARFADLARDYSEDPTSASRGGLLPPAERGKYQEAFDEYCWSGEIGEVSDIVRTTFGFHIIKIESRQISDADLYEQEVRRRALEAEEASSESESAPE